jgi:glycosyltransferase involved in cell wall biosynthesis
MTRTVLHYVPRWLPLSEQYVDQLVRRSSYRPVVVARHELLNLDAFPQAPLVCLGRALRPVPQRLRRQATGLALSRLVRRHGAALLHVHSGFETDGVVGAARRAGVPLVLSVHGHDVTGPRTPALRRTLVEADAVVVPSAFLGDRVGRDVHVLPSGVDLSVFTPQPWPEGPPTAVFVGRFVEKKGLDVLAAAWPAVVARVPAARLIVLGDGPLPPPDVAERWVPHPRDRAAQVRAALARATVVVTPSRTAADGDSESLLLVNLEAQAVGRPVVSTRHGGIPDFVDDSTALLVPEGDAAALADALVSVLSDPDRARRMGAAGPAVAARFDADRCAAEVDRLYDRLLT